MSDRIARQAVRFPCEICPLRPLEAFREFEKSELDFVSKFKKGELSVERGATILVEGTYSPHLYTVLLGWGFRYKLLSDGRRQILNYAMPGDLIGLQASLMGEMQHSIEALSPMLLCVFERQELYTLYRDHPSLAFDLTWIASREERILDENLLSVGRRTAIERAAYLIAFVHSRAQAVGLNGQKPLELPLTQQHLADTLGLSLVHTNKTVRRLTEHGLVRWLERGCEVLDVKGLMGLADWGGFEEHRRPFV
jgi:CRP-like cAMP-binding protein